MEMSAVWVFHGADARFSGGVFSSRELAAAWIEKHSLTGVLTKYLVDEGIYDYAVEHGWFPSAKQVSSGFIGSFTSARQEHYHFTNDIHDGEISGS